MKLVPIKSKKEVYYNGKVYDLEVKNSHSYNIDGVIVHNSDFVMIGGMFAGTDESAGDIIERKYMTNELEPETGHQIIETKYFKRFYGMSSDTAMKKHHGGVADYRASEGKTVEVPYRGPVSEIIKDALGGLRSACTYSGARRLKDLPKCATFVRVNNQINNVFGVS